MNDVHPSMKFTLMSFGTTAKYCVSQVASRLRSLDIQHITIHTIQPVAYYRYIDMVDKIGIDPEYMCFTKRGMAFMRELFQGHEHINQLSPRAINMSASVGL